MSDLDQLRSRYEVLRRLGHDGACVVYGVRNRSSHRHFAVKVMENPESRSTKPGTLHVWQAHTVEPLDHPNLMVLHAVHHLQGGTIAIAMERRRGRTLAEMIDDAGPLPVEQVELVLRDVAAGLAYLHGRGAVHRAVGPHSIFLDRDSGRARLAPFGIDRAGGEANITAASGPDSGVPYLAPEQIAGEVQLGDRRVSARSDLYSLGLVGYAMLTGRRPWADASLDSSIDMRDSERFAPLAALRADAPTDLCQAIEGCLEENPRRRWSSAEELLARLDPAAEGARAAPTTGLAGLRVRIENGVAALRAALAARVSVPRPGKRALAVPGAVIALVVLSMLRGSDEPVTESASMASVAPADATLPTVIVRPPGSILDDPSPNAANPGVQASRSTTPAAAPQRERSAVAPSRRPGPAGESAAPGGLVLLGDPISRQPPQPLLGDPLRTTNSGR